MLGDARVRQHYDVGTTASQLKNIIIIIIIEARKIIIIIDVSSGGQSSDYVATKRREGGGHRGDGGRRPSSIKRLNRYYNKRLHRYQTSESLYQQTYQANESLYQQIYQGNESLVPCTANYAIATSIVVPARNRARENDIERDSVR